MSEDKKENDNLDYNDGLGDLLKEKEKHTFSWPKTIIIIISIIGVIVITLSVIFSWGKTQIIKQDILIKKSAPSSKVLKEKTQKHTEKRNAKELSASKKIITSSKKTPPIQKKIKKSQKKDPKKLVILKANTAPLKYTAKIRKYPYKVITGTFKNKKNALKQKQKLNKKGFKAFIWASTTKDKKKLYKVQAGAFATRKEATAYKKKISLKGFQSYIIIKKK